MVIHAGGLAPNPAKVPNYQNMHVGSSPIKNLMLTMIQSPSKSQKTRESDPSHLEMKLWILLKSISTNTLLLSNNFVCVALLLSIHKFLQFVTRDKS